MPFDPTRMHAPAKPFPVPKFGTSFGARHVRTGTQCFLSLKKKVNAQRTFSCTCSGAPAPPSRPSSCRSSRPPTAASRSGPCPATTPARRPRWPWRRPPPSLACTAAAAPRPCSAPPGTTGRRPPSPRAGAPAPRRRRGASAASGCSLLLLPRRLAWLARSCLPVAA